MSLASLASFALKLTGRIPGPQEFNRDQVG
jgi:hypothetical protein